MEDDPGIGERPEEEMPSRIQRRNGQNRGPRCALGKSRLGTAMRPVGAVVGGRKCCYLSQVSFLGCANIGCGWCQDTAKTRSIHSDWSGQPQPEFQFRSRVGHRRGKGRDDAELATGLASSPLIAQLAFSLSFLFIRFNFIFFTSTIPSHCAHTAMNLY